MRPRCTKAAALPQHSISAPANPNCPNCPKGNITQRLTEHRVHTPPNTSAMSLKHQTSSRISRRALAPVNPNCPQGNITQRLTEQHVQTPPNTSAMSLKRQTSSRISRRALAPVDPNCPKDNITQRLTEHRVHTPPNTSAMSLKRHASSRISRRALAPVNPIARRATSRSVLLNTAFTHHRTLRQCPLPAMRVRCTKAAALPQHSISAPVNPIARRTTSRSALLNNMCKHHQTLRQCPLTAMRPRCTKAAALPLHSISAPGNPIARRATSQRLAKQLVHIAPF